ncbi:MAG: hypothetical protein ACKKMS_00150 [Candidatus Nealsonbacteria bacterium]
METKTITTPMKGHKIELREWITGKEYEEIQKPITDIRAIFETTGIGKGMGRGEVNVGEASRKSTENAIKIIVISVDGEDKNILGKVQSMRSEDYLFVLKEVDNIATGKNFILPAWKPEGSIDSES